MKKFLILIVLLGSVGVFYHLLQTPPAPPAAAFDAQGRPLVRLFIGPGCEKPCAALATELQNRNIHFMRIDVNSPEGKALGVTQYPQLQIGDHLASSSVVEILGLLGHSLGHAALTPEERSVFRHNFDTAGHPRVVLFSTEWCAYCKKQRAFFERHNIPYLEINPEKSATTRAIYDALEGDGFPLTYVGYQRFDGYHEEDLLKAITALH